MTGTAHVIGAGLAGLAAATRLAPSHRVIVHEAARMAGGRCRSYFDPTLGLTIDNGNHLLLSGNGSAHAYLERIGARDALVGPGDCVFDFADLRNGARWQVRPNAGRIPWWMFSSDRRVPGTSVGEYLDGARLLRADDNSTIASTMRKRGRAWTHLWEPVFVSALNTKLDEASAKLAAAVMRESLGAGGDASRSRVARDGLGPAFIEPALATLAKAGAEMRIGARVRDLRFRDGAIVGFTSGGDSIDLSADDRVVLAVPPWVAIELVPDLTAPRCASRYPERAFCRAATERPSTDHRTRGRPQRVALRVSRPAIGNGQRGRRSHRCATRRTRFTHLGRSRHRDRSLAGPAAVADREGEARDVCRDAGTGPSPPVRADAVAQPLSCRRLDANRTSGNHRRRYPLR